MSSRIATTIALFAVVVLDLFCAQPASAAPVRLYKVTNVVATTYAGTRVHEFNLVLVERTTVKGQVVETVISTTPARSGDVVGNRALVAGFVNGVTQPGWISNGSFTQTVGTVTATYSWNSR
jgi:hypothetical protein